MPCIRPRLLGGPVQGLTRPCSGALGELDALSCLESTREEAGIHLRVGNYSGAQKVAFGVAYIEPCKAFYKALFRSPQKVPGDYSPASHGTQGSLWCILWRVLAGLKCDCFLIQKTSTSCSFLGWSPQAGPGPPWGCPGLPQAAVWVPFSAPIARP